MPQVASISPFNPPQVSLNSLPSAAQVARNSKEIPLGELEKLSSLGLSQGNGLQSTGSGTFSNVLGNFVREVNDKQLAAGAAYRGVMSGEGVPLHHAIIAGEEAGISFRLMVEVRNKLLEAYKEIMRMSV